MTTTRSASRAAMLSRSAADAASTVSMPRPRAARMILSAISPRLATRMRLSAMARPSGRLDQKQRLIVFDEFRILDQHFPYSARDAGQDGGEEFHHLDE